MAFREVQFPTGISRGASGGRTFRTTVVAASSGTEQRIAQWSSPLGEWDVSHALRTPTQMEDLQAFFYAIGGRADSFRFKDWGDYAVTTAQATVQLTTTTFQLTRRYAYGGLSHARPIKKPVAATTHVWHTGSEVVGGWTVDTTTGIVTFGAAPGYVPDATFEFDVPARFDVDSLAVELQDAEIRNWEGIRIVEVRI